MHPRLGLKRTVPTGTKEETEELQQLYANLSQQLSTPRIERLAGRALAAWDAEEQAACVVRKDGKFGNFGYSRDGNYYLEYFEAMFLLELGRLQLEYHSMVMSVEQAYLLLLGESASPKYNEYLVYSYLSRMGYILVRHQNVSYYERVEATAADCAWALALGANGNGAIPDYVKRSPHYSNVKKSAQQIKQRIMQQQPCVDNNEVHTSLEVDAVSIKFDRKIKPCSKRKVERDEQENTIEIKRRCLAAAAEHKSLVDQLKDEPEYKQFQHIFAKFDIIKLTADIECNDSCRSLQINFDLYLHNDGFKKSTPKPPTLRVIILDVSETFPTHAEISLCQQLQKWPVPLLVVSVGESKQIQAFLYYFS